MSENLVIKAIELKPSKENIYKDTLEKIKEKKIAMIGDPFSGRRKRAGTAATVAVYNGNGFD